MNDGWEYLAHTKFDSNCWKDFEESFKSQVYWKVNKSSGKSRINLAYEQSFYQVYLGKSNPFYIRIRKDKKQQNLT